MVNVDGSGNVTLVSGSQFTPALAGTWITIAGVSYNILTVTSATALILASAPAAPVTNGAYTANEVPIGIRLGMLVLIAHWYNNREAVVVGRSVTSDQVELTVDDLLAGYRVWGEHAA